MFSSLFFFACLVENDGLDKTSLILVVKSVFELVYIRFCVIGTWSKRKQNYM